MPPLPAPLLVIHGTDDRNAPDAHRCGNMMTMTYDDALAIASVVDDPDDFLDIVNDLLALRWSDGTHVVEP